VSSLDVGISIDITDRSADMIEHCSSQWDQLLLYKPPKDQTNLVRAQ
jgi:hypothetical protein